MLDQMLLVYSPSLGRYFFFGVHWMKTYIAVDVSIYPRWKINSFSALKGFFFAMKMQKGLSRTSAATYKLMEPTGFADWTDNKLIRMTGAHEKKDRRWLESNPRFLSRASRANLQAITAVKGAEF